MNPHLLIIEDETDLALLIDDYAKAAGYRTTIFHDGLLAFNAVELAAQENIARTLHSQWPDCIVLDLMLPGLDGLSFCKQVRAFSQVPIIMVTAKVEEIDRLIGLETGADDYLCKPFSPRELMARIKTILRRSNSVDQQKMTLPIFQLNTELQSILVLGKILNVTKSEYHIFSCLFKHQGKILSRAQLLDYANEDNLEVTERAIDSHIKNLRKKIDAQLPDNINNPIHSIYGLGYRFDL